jgi:hypothetical protein
MDLLLKIEPYADIISLLSNVIVSLGIFLAILSYLRDHKRDIRLRENEIIKSNGESFVRYQELMLENSDLPLSIYHAKEAKDSLTQDQKIRCFIFFDIMITAFERVYYFHRSGTKKMFSDGWSGWDIYIRSMCEVDLLREWWLADDYGYGREFSNYLTSCMREVENKKLRSPRILDTQEDTISHREKMAKGKNLASPYL